MSKKESATRMHDEDSDSDSTSSRDESHLPPAIQNLKNKVVIGKYSPLQTQSYTYHSSFNSVGYDNSFHLKEFKKNFKIRIISSAHVLDEGSKSTSTQEEHLLFDMIGIDAALANTFRRIMISEVPTMAIEQVVVVNNTSIMQDEVLAHRIGLIPIKADPNAFLYKNPNRFKQQQDETVEEEEDNYNKQNTLISGLPGSSADTSAKMYEPEQTLYDYETILMKLDVTCSKKPGNYSADISPDEQYNHSRVLSSDLKWIPLGNQGSIFKKSPIRPVHDDILICKLRPGQNIHLELYIEKGVGKTHAKWSPVSTATYRLLPEIVFKKPITGEKAEQLKKKCPMNVFDIEDGEAVVARPRDCTMCRECIREDGWDNMVKLQRVKDHFIFSVESTGILKPSDIFLQSIQVLRKKCLAAQAALRKHQE